MYIQVSALVFVSVVRNQKSSQLAAAGKEDVEAYIDG